MSNELCKCGKVGIISCPNDERCGKPINQLPADVQERIKADAIAHVQATRGQEGRVETYIAGATAEVESVVSMAGALQEAKDTIEWMWEHMKEADGQTLLQVDHFNRPANALHIIDLALQQWKEGKVVEL